MNSSLIISISLLSCGLVGIALSIPMLLGKISRNHFYGFRTSLTLSSDKIWYPANKFAGKGLLIWGVLNIIISIPTFWMHPMSDLTQLLFTIPQLAVVIPCLVSAIWVNRNFRKTEQGAASNHLPRGAG
jgi:uncharacterized membrane protein